MFFFPLGELFLFFQVPAWQGKFIEVSVLPTSRREHLMKSRRTDSILFRGYCELHIVGGPGKPPVLIYLSPRPPGPSLPSGLVLSWFPHWVPPPRRSLRMVSDPEFCP